MTTAIVKSEQLPDRVRGDRPAHTHRDSSGRTWQCNSPYCGDTGFDGEHPDNGGLEPIVQGREPWRGR